MEYTDFITRKVEQVYVVQESSQFKKMNNPKYIPIFEILKEKPLTIKELVEKYNVIADKPKKQTSIYNYLTDLIDSGLIVKSGQRVISGKTATEVLYGRRAKLYYVTSQTIHLLKSANGKKLIDQLAELVKLYTNSEISDTKSLSDLIQKIYSTSSEGISRIIEKNVDEVYEITKTTTFEQLNQVTSVLDILILLINISGYDEELKEILVKK